MERRAAHGAIPDSPVPPPIPHPTSTTLLRLGAAYALAWATTSMTAGPGSAMLVSLTGNLSFAGMYVALFYVGSATGAALGGRAMDRVGRKPPLVAAYGIAAVAFAAAGAGARLQSTPVFVAGTFLLAACFGTANLTRLAAAELFPPSERGRGVAWVQIAAIFGAVAGPVLLLFSTPLGSWLGRPALETTWFIAPPLLLVAALIVSRASEPRTVSHAPDEAKTPPTVTAPVPVSAKGSVILAGTVSLAASQSAMAAVMGVAGAAVTHEGHGVSTLSGLMLLHFVGMFALSRLAGRMADTMGRSQTILGGLGLLAAGGAIAAFTPGVAGFGIGLMIVGFGWSFSFIGSTVLLTDAAAPAVRARTLGRADLIAQLSAATIATGGGWWFATHGLAGLGLLAVIVAMAPVPLVLRAR